MAHTANPRGGSVLRFYRLLRKKDIMRYILTTKLYNEPINSTEHDTIFGVHNAIRDLENSCHWLFLVPDLVDGYFLGAFVRAVDPKRTVGIYTYRVELTGVDRISGDDDGWADDDYEEDSPPIEP